MKYCPICGKENPDDAQACASCGSALAPASGAPAPPVFTTTPQTSGKAIGSLICGILFPFLPAAIVAVILGHLALSEIRKSAGRIAGRGIATAGLVLGYMGLAVIPLLIIAAIAIPNLLRSRNLANEAVAAGTLRNMTQAAVTYYSEHNNGYAPSLGALGGPAGAVTASCDNALLIDNILSNNGSGDTATKDGYIFTYTPGPATGIDVAGCTNQGATSYTIVAVPEVFGSTGRKGFFVDETGVIRFTVDGSTPTGDSPLLQ
ncbi:MAG: DUF4190 domain-containing protein [Candidatus Acidiferrales bacterium]